MIIRQEVNYLVSNLNLTSAYDLPERIRIDTAQYSGTVSYFFEIVCKNTSGTAGSILLRRQFTSTNDSTITVPGNTAEFTRFRAQFTPPAGATAYMVRNNVAIAAGVQMVAARLVIIQDTGASALTATATQVELGNFEETKTNTAVSELSYPKYWTYNASEWDGTIDIWGECSSKHLSNMNTKTAVLQQDDGNYGGWTNVLTIVSTTTNAINHWRSAGSFKPIDGRHYRFASSISGNNHSDYSGKLIVVQSGTNITKLQPQYQLLPTQSVTTGATGALNLYDAAEISGINATFRHQMDSIGSNSTKISSSAGTDVTGSTVTGSTQVISPTISLVSGTAYNTNIISSGAAPNSVSSSRILMTLASGPPTVTTAKTQTGLAAVRSTAMRTQTGVASIDSPTKRRTQSGISRVTRAISAHQTGVARIAPAPVFARPNRDALIGGAWTITGGDGINLYTAIDEAVADSADFISSPSNPDANAFVRFGLSNVDDPDSSTGHIIRYRISKDAAAGKDIQFVVTLRQIDDAGTDTLIASYTESLLSDVPTDFEKTLTAAEADAITDYNNLYIRFDPTASGGGAARVARLYFLELETPAPSYLIRKKLQTGAARIANTVLKPQTGVGWVVATVLRTQTGTSRLTAAITRNQTGIASIQGVTSPVRTLVDNFNDNATDATKWDVVTSNGTVAEINAQLEIAGNSTAFGYSGYRSKSAYNLTSDALYVHLKQATNAEIGAETIFRVNLSNANDANYIGFVKGNDSLIPRYQVAGTQNDIYPIYSAVNHQWLRIRHDGTDIIWEAAPDNAGVAGTYTELRRVALATIGLDITRVYVEALAGQYQAVVGTGTGTAHYDNLNEVVTVTSTKTQTGVARLTVSTTRQQTGTARIQISTGRVQTGLARITVTTPRTQSGLSRILINTIRTQTGVSRITNVVLRIQTGKSRIQTSATRNQTGLSRITRIWQQNQSGTGRVEESSNRVQSGLARISQSVGQAQTGIARLTVVTTRVQSGIGRILISTSKPQSGLSRLTIVTSKPQTGVGQVRVSVSKTILGQSRITSSILAAQTGIARVTAATSRPQTGKSAIRQTTSQTQSGTATIGGATLKAQTAVSRIQTSTSRQQSGVARVQTAVNQIIQGTARLSQIVLKAQTGLARVSSIVLRAQTGITNMAGAITQPITGTARITASTLKAQMGKARLANTITGLVRYLSYDATRYSLIPHSASNNVGNADSYAVEFYFRTTTKGVDQSISEKWYDDGPPLVNKYPWAIRGPLGTTGNMSFAIYDGTNNPGVSTSKEMSDGQWHRLIGVRDFANDQIRIYVDGQLRNSATDTTTGDVSTDRHITIGARTPTGQRWTGDVMHHRLWGGALTNAQVADLEKGILPAVTLLQDIRMNGSVDDIQSPDLSGNSNHLQVKTGLWSGTAMTGKAAVKRTTTQIQTGLARIALITSKPQSGTANVRNAQVRQQSGLAQVKVLRTSPQTGIANVGSATVRTITGQASVRNAQIRPQSGKSNVRVSTSRPQTGLSHIIVTSTTIRGQFGTAAVRKSVSRTISGLARIQVSQPRHQSGVTRITINTTRLQIGQTRIVQVVVRSQSGRANIQNAIVRNQSGRSRIGISTLKAITGRARVEQNALRNVTGQSRIAATILRTITGAARIAIVTVRTQTGQSRVTLVPARTITGRSRITQITKASQFGVSRLLNAKTPKKRRMQPSLSNEVRGNIKMSSTSVVGMRSAQKLMQERKS